jgi:hypothetical protein
MIEDEENHSIVSKLKTNLKFKTEEELDEIH